MVSVIIAAHNEEAVIGRCLDALLGHGCSEPLDIIVSANGCSDSTARIARDRGVAVLDLPEAGKAGALNAGDAVARSYPRVYLDADIVVPPDGIQHLVGSLEAHPRALAVVPKRRVETAGRPFAVRGYFAISERLPAFRSGLFGRGMIALSETGRSRFSAFPALIADDLFLDSLFADAEKAVAADVEVVVEAPYSTADLLRRLVRVRRGNMQMREAASNGDLAINVRQSDKWAWLKVAVVTDPRLAFAAIPYAALTALAGLLARRSDVTDWGRDLSTRTAMAGRGEAA